MSDDDAYLLDMFEAAQLACRFLGDTSLDEFHNHIGRQFQVIHALQLVGETATKVNAGTRSAIPAIPWRAIINMRHRLVHDYGGLDLATVHRTVPESSPEPIALLEPHVDSGQRPSWSSPPHPDADSGDNHV
jgi:uncharacterized protein with HEPN domain